MTGVILSRRKNVLPVRKPDYCSQMCVWKWESTENWIPAGAAAVSGNCPCKSSLAVVVGLCSTVMNSVHPHCLLLCCVSGTHSAGYLWTAPKIGDSLVIQIKSATEHDSESEWNKPRNQMCIDFLSFWLCSAALEGTWRGHLVQLSLLQQAEQICVISERFSSSLLPEKLSEQSFD